MRLGHDFGRTPFGLEAVATAARRGGTPAPGICICDPWFRARGIFDGRCPSHGLAATLLTAVRQLREDEAC